MLEFGGIHCMLLAGLNIRETPMKLTPHPPAIWATIHEAPFLPLRYLHYLLQLAGVPEDTVGSIFYSKADQVLGNQARTFVGHKKILERRALMQERPTIIFTTPAALQQFLQHWPQSHASRHFPNACLGYVTNIPLPPQTPLLVAQGTPVPLEDFTPSLSSETINLLNPSHFSISPQSELQFAPRVCFLMTARLLKMAQHQLDSETFRLAVEELHSHLLPKLPQTENTPMEMDSTANEDENGEAAPKEPRAEVSSDSAFLALLSNTNSIS